MKKQDEIVKCANCKKAYYGYGCPFCGEVIVEFDGKKDLQLEL